MRVVALVACLAILGAALRPEASLAQPSAAAEHRSVPRAGGQHAGPQAGASATTAPATTENLEPPPVSPTFSSLSLLGDHLHAVRWELGIVGAAIVTVGIKDWDWGNGSGFQTIEEGWFSKNTRHGGMDKIGHSFSTFVIADLLTDRIRANASDPTGAPITAALVAFGIMGLVETVDGFTGRHRFSREDIVANGVGALFSIFRNTVPGLREKLDWRIMYTPASFERPGITTDAGILPPYERQRYIMALKGSGFETLRNTPLRYAELHVGFDARGFERRERELGYPIERSFYVGVGLNLNEVLFGSGPQPNFARYRDTLPGWAVRKTFEYVQVPYTSVYHENRFSTVRRVGGTFRD
ncbi:DUF2279 domain-containing protein [Microvirga lenta]|uniref:DUF2279 domain-containing protein n=1 Tax=Microvirga lenta TaxID=2881337 RepID=UPI001CFF7B99|nr:DUF2279 domain-containing protein [Microvirga lenta]MCB5174769.1 YfiM family protein [Microvirga lenta]